MLFAVISEPRPEPPSQVAPSRQRYWSWVEPLIKAGTVRHIYARTGRGALAIFDVDSNETLHRLITEWSEIIPARFDIYPLIEAQAAQQFLAGRRE
jgi:muconolactone delta-isomerase